jgi:6-phosphogluconolactonase (cycloisomerase 2 family)
MRTIAKYLKVFAVFLVTLSLVTCSGAPSCTLEGSNPTAVGAGRFLRAAAASGCPTGGGGGGNNTCSATLTPTEVLFSQSATGSINTLAINTGGNALALMCTTATANSGQIAVANVTATGANYLYVLTPPTKAGANTVIINGFAIGHVAPVALTPVSNPGGSITITGAGFFTGFFELQADPFGQFLTLTDTSKSVVHVLLINSTTGALSVAPGSPFPAANALFTAAGTTNGVEYLYVSDNFDAQIRIFSVNVTSPTKVLTEILLNSPFLVHGGQSVNSPITMLVSPNGNFLYTANDQSISIYTIQIDGSLTAPLSPVTPAPLFNPQFLAVDNTGSFLYVSGTGTEGVLGFAILANGSLSAINGGTPFATGTTGVTDMVADPSLAVLYLVINGVINPYNIQTNSGGGLTLPTVTPTFVASTNLAIANVQ